MRAFYVKAGRRNKSGTAISRQWSVKNKTVNIFERKSECFESLDLGSLVLNLNLSRKSNQFRLARLFHFEELLE